MVHPKKNQVARVLCDGKFPYEKMREMFPPIRARVCLKPAYEMRSVENPQEWSGKNAGARGYIKDANTWHPFNPVLTIVLCTSHIAAAFNYFFLDHVDNLYRIFYHLKLKELFGVFSYFYARNLGAFIKGKLQQISDKM